MVCHQCSSTRADVDLAVTVSNVGPNSNCHFSGCDLPSYNLDPHTSKSFVFRPSSSCPSFQYKMVNENYFHWANCEVDFSELPSPTPSPTPSPWRSSVPSPSQSQSPLTSPSPLASPSPSPSPAHGDGGSHTLPVSTAAVAATVTGVTAVVAGAAAVVVIRRRRRHRAYAHATGSDAERELDSHPSESTSLLAGAPVGTVAHVGMELRVTPAVGTSNPRGWQ
jgi:hypothetical protein